MHMNSEILEGYRFAADVAKQLITLSTGVLGVSLAFANYMKDRMPHGSDRVLRRAAALFLGSIAFGIVVLASVAGHLGKGTGEGIYAWNIRWTALGQFLLFMTALGFTVRYFLLTAAPTRAEAKPPETGNAPGGEAK
jgi:hypothetical protein